MSLEVQSLEENELRELFKVAESNGWIIPAHFPDEKKINASCPDGFFPLKKDIFKAFTLVAPQDVKYVVLGMDPYPDSYPTGLPHATGVAFGVATTEGLPSQTAIFKVLKGIYGGDKERKTKCSLEEWSRTKGVLLLNAALTVPRHIARGDVRNRHFDYWFKFIRSIVKELPSATYIAWGKDALALYKTIGIFDVKSCNHPAASQGKLGSFAEFWKNEGECLRVPLSTNHDDTKG